jgi:ATP-binding cassette, subfamily A (ABC1), member 3
MLCGLFPATSGTVRAFGIDALSDVSALREELGFCPQHNIIFPELTAAEHLRLWAGFKAVPSGEVEQEVQKILQQVRLGMLDKMTRVSRRCNPAARVLRRPCAGRSLREA